MNLNPELLEQFKHHEGSGDNDENYILSMKKLKYYCFSWLWCVYFHLQQELPCWEVLVMNMIMRKTIMNIIMRIK